MTLFRQVALLVSLIFVLLMTVLAWNNFQSSSQFLQGQMQTSAQDMATNLGVTIANVAQDDDLAAIDTLFNTVFDSGYYSRFELRSSEGELILDKQQQVMVVDTPQWFVSLVGFTPATGRSQIMKGWQPYATLSITLHPGYVYASLYATLKSMLIWLVVIGAVGLVALWLLLNLVMRPLKTVQHQAEAIHENRFILHNPLPRTLELREVADAMNLMIGKVQKVFNDQINTLKRYHKLLYRDPLTGLGNRRYFMMKLNEIISDEAASHGWLVMIHIHGLDAMNRNDGRQATDEMIVTLSRLLEQKSSPEGREYCVRLNSSEFVGYISDSVQVAKEYIDSVFDSFRNDSDLHGKENQLWLCGGMTPLESGCQLSEVLSDIDFALTQSKGMGAYAQYHNVKHQVILPLGKMQWRNWLEESLNENRFFLVGQDVRNGDDSLYHRELFVRLRDGEDRTILAGTFMPVASSLGLDFAIDRAVFRMAMDLHEEGSTDSIALNLSSTFLNSADALVEFERFIDRYIQGGRAPLYVEVSHFALLQHAESAEYIADRLRSAGCFFGIDRLDLGSSLQPLQLVRPHYIKIGVRQLDDISDERINVGFQALKTLADGMDIQLIAVGVESMDSFNRLKKLGVHAMQGDYLGEAQELK